MQWTWVSLGGKTWFTLPETNIFAPENGWLEYYFPIGEAYFQGRTVSFREGNYLISHFYSSIRYFFWIKDFPEQSSVLGGPPDLKSASHVDQRDKSVVKNVALSPPLSLFIFLVIMLILF